MRKGEIFHVLLQPQEGYRHYFVFWSDNGGGSYLGVMLTHSDSIKFTDNIPMEDHHFKSGFKFQNENSHFVACLLIKDIPTSNLEKTGELTNEGIKHIESHISKMPIKTWREYKK